MYITCYMLECLLLHNIAVMLSMRLMICRSHVACYGSGHHVKVQQTRRHDIFHRRKDVTSRLGMGLGKPCPGYVDRKCFNRKKECRKKKFLKIFVIVTILRETVYKHIYALAYMENTLFYQCG